MRGSRRPSRIAGPIDGDSKTERTKGGGALAVPSASICFALLLSNSSRAPRGPRERASLSRTQAAESVRPWMVNHCGCSRRRLLQPDLEFKATDLQSCAHDDGSQVVFDCTNMDGAQSLTCSGDPGADGVHFLLECGFTIDYMGQPVNCPCYVWVSGSVQYVGPTGILGVSQRRARFRPRHPRRTAPCKAR